MKTEERQPSIAFQWDDRLGAYTPVRRLIHGDPSPTFPEGQYVMQYEWMIPHTQVQSSPPDSQRANENGYFVVTTWTTEWRDQETQGEHETMLEFSARIN